MMRFFFVDPRTGNINYKHQLPNKKWFVRGTKTSDPRKADQLWSTIDAEYNALAAQQRSRSRYTDSKDARREKFWSAVARFLIVRKAGNGGRLPVVYGSAMRGEADKEVVPTSTAFASHPFVVVRNEFLIWAQEHDPDAVAVFEMGDKNNEHLFHMGLIASYFVVRELERLQGPAPITVSTPAIPHAPAPIPPDQHTLQDVFERWTRETNPAEATKGDVRRAMTIFTAANPVSDPESPHTVEQVTRKHVQRMRDALGKRNLTNQTRNKRIAGMSILFGQAVNGGWIESNPTKGVKFEVKDGDRKKREAFDRDEIKTWMRHPCFTDHQFDAYGWSEFWIPLLCLWHGARRNEIGHLLTSDIRKIDEIWIINIDGRVGGGEGKKIKTAASRREIPLHPKLIEMGFLRWVKTVPPGRLFDNCPIERDGSIGCISKIVRAQLNQVGADGGLSLHSARHSFRTFARSVEPSIDPGVVDAIVGHAPASQGGRYGDVPLRTKLKAISRINIGALPKPYETNRFL
jgi:integrase